MPAGYENPGNYLYTAPSLLMMMRERAGGGFPPSMAGSSSEQCPLGEHLLHDHAGRRDHGQAAVVQLLWQEDRQQR